MRYCDDIPPRWVLAVLSRLDADMMALTSRFFTWMMVLAALQRGSFSQSCPAYADSLQELEERFNCLERSLDQLLESSRPKGMCVVISWYNNITSMMAVILVLISRPRKMALLKERWQCQCFRYLRKINTIVFTKLFTIKWTKLCYCYC